LVQMLTFPNDFYKGKATWVRIVFLLTWSRLFLQEDFFFYLCWLVLLHFISVKSHPPTIQGCVPKDHQTKIVLPFLHSHMLWQLCTLKFLSEIRK
jgi:hypothetical protein